MRRAIRRLLRSPQASAGQAATAIFVLGGAREREEFAARLASRRWWRGGTLPLFISSGSYRYLADFDPGDPSNVHRHRMHGVDFARMRTRTTMDRRAVDTVGNFTTMVGPIADAGHRKVLIVTSRYHVQRASWCAGVVLGSYDIEFSMLVCDSEAAPESESWGAVRTCRDTLRCMAWVMFGLSGDTVARWWHPDRT